MNSSKCRFLITFIALSAVLVSLVACNDTKTKNVKEVNNGSVVSTQPVPTFNDEAYKLIADPCTTITIESINELVPGSKDSGSLQQNTVGPNKTCEWKVDDVNYPRLGISIIESTDFFKADDERIIENPVLGSKVSIAPEYVIVLGGDSCGSTIYVVTQKYSFSVAYCDIDGKATTDEKLLELATQVKNSIPTT